MKFEEIWKMFCIKAVAMPLSRRKTEKKIYFFCLINPKWAGNFSVLLSCFFVLFSFFGAALAAENIPSLKIKDLRDDFSTSRKLPGSLRRNLKINHWTKIHPMSPLATQVPLLQILNRSLGLLSPSWSEKNPCDQWEGLECNNKREVVKISLSFRFLKGNIPSSLGDLLSLKELDLSRNIYLNGEIPSNLGKLKGLQILLLNENSLSGAIPKSLINLREVQFLDFSNNKLMGEVPFELQFLPNLKQMLFDNDVKLEFPSENF